MARKHKHQAQAETQALVVYEAPTTELVVTEPEVSEDQQKADNAEIDAQISLPKSVVKAGYKLRYKERAIANNHTRKAAKRSTWDWLAQTLAGETLTKDNKLKVDEFLAVLDANGVSHANWQGSPLCDKEPTKGWEGRLRMTGRLALQRVVAETGILHLPDGEQLEAPEEWVAKYLH